MSTLKRKLKKILKSDHAKTTDVCIFISEYFNEIGFIKMSPLDVRRESTQEQLIHNFFLARAYFAKKYHMRLRKERIEKPKLPKKGQYWTDYDWKLWHYDADKLHWAEITTPLHPGKDIFEHETEDITSQDLLDQINEIEDLIKKAEDED